MEKSQDLLTGRDGDCYIMFSYQRADTPSADEVLELLVGTSCRVPRPERQPQVPVPQYRAHAFVAGSVKLFLGYFYYHAWLLPTLYILLSFSVLMKIGYLESQIWEGSGGRTLIYNQSV